MHSHSDEFTVRPDSKGRITLGKLAKGISSFRVSKDEKGGIYLKPYVEIPADVPERERWVYENPEVLASLKRGLKQAAEGDTYYLGDFSKYLDDKDEQSC